MFKTTDQFLFFFFFFFFEVIERIMYNILYIILYILYIILYEYFINNNLPHENQFGFQINNLTEYAILKFTLDIAQNFNYGKVTLGSFIHYSKA